MQNSEGDLAAGGRQEAELHRAERPDLGHARALLHGDALLRRARRRRWSRGLPGHQECRRHPDRGDRGGGRGRPGRRDPRRIRRPARPEPGGRRRRAAPGRGERQRPRLRPQPLGSGSLLAATAVKDYLAANGLPGRVRYYGCPAEEGGAAKGFMVRAGAFDDVDVAISWHPAFLRRLRGESLANTRIDFTFTGRAAHAAGAPHLGRSALDAVELMNVGVNYMREHMPGPRARPLRAARCGRRRTERGPGHGQGALPDPRRRPGRAGAAGRAGPQDRRRAPP